MEWMLASIRMTPEKQSDAIHPTKTPCQPARQENSQPPKITVSKFFRNQANLTTLNNPAPLSHQLPQHPNPHNSSDFSLAPLRVGPWPLHHPHQTAAGPSANQSHYQSHRFHVVDLAGHYCSSACSSALCFVCRMVLQHGCSSGLYYDASGPYHLLRCQRTYSSWEVCHSVP